MAKVVKLKSSDLIRLVEETLNILPNQNDLPKRLAELEKLVSEGKRTINRMYHLILDLNLRQILEEPEKYDRILKDMEETHAAYSKRHNYYDDIIESYWDAYTNDELDFNTIDTYNKYNKVLTELYNLDVNMGTLFDIFEELHDTARRRDILKDFTDSYPDQTINIDKSLNISNNEN
jgi:hypothetical protein